MYSEGGADVAEVEEDVVVGRTVDFDEDVGGELPNNSKAPIPVAMTAPAPAYFRKRRLDGCR